MQTSCSSTQSCKHRTRWFAPHALHLCSGGVGCRLRKRRRSRQCLPTYLLSLFHGARAANQNVMVWDFSGTTAVAVPYTPESSAHAARLEGIITRLALRAKQGKQVGPSTTAGRFEATMFSPAVTVATAPPSSLFSTASDAAAALPVQPSVRPEASTSSELACTPRGRVRGQGKVRRATVSILPFLHFLFLRLFCLRTAVCTTVDTFLPCVVQPVQMILEMNARAAMHG